MNTDKTKSERVRLYFAETARDIILSDGIEGVSARKVALKAGYSLRTIYNHFSSLDEILWYARSIMIADLGNELMKKSPLLIKSVNDLKLIFRNYMAYFIDNPNIYRFFYFHHLNNKEKSVSSLADSPEFSEQIESSFIFLLQDGLYSQKEVSTIIQTIIYTIQGILTMITTDNDNVEVETAYEQLDKIIEFLIHKLL